MNKERGNLTANKYDASIHRIARAMYEVEGQSVREISEELGIGKHAVLNWKKKEVWKKKGADIEKVQYLTTQNFMERMAERGVPPEKALDLLADGMLNPSTDEIIGLDEDKKPIIQSTKDYNTMHKYQKDYWKMARMLDGPAKGVGGITAGEGGVVNVQVNIPALEDE